MCACAVPSIFTWSGNFKNYGYQTSAGWYCSKYAQPSSVRNLLWPNTQPAPCPCLLHFLFCNPEQGLWDRVADILFYWSTFCFVFVFFQIGTHQVAQAGLGFPSLVSDVQVLGLQVCGTIPASTSLLWPVMPRKFLQAGSDSSPLTFQAGPCCKEHS